MKCKQIKDLMGAYLYGDLTPEEMREVRLHANECTDCRQDLQTRSEVIASVSDRLPELKDMERQKIAWYVEGAVRSGKAREQERFRLAPAFAAGLVVIAAGVAAGIYVAANLVSPPFQQAGQRHKTPVQATVKIQEEPVDASAKQKSETAQKKPDSRETDSDTRRITHAIANAMQSALRGGVGVTRGHEDVEQRSAPSEEVVEQVPNATEGVKPAESSGNEAQSPTRLPAPSNLNDARTQPSANGE